MAVQDNENVTKKFNDLIESMQKVSEEIKLTSTSLEKLSANLGKRITKDITERDKEKAETEAPFISFSKDRAGILNKFTRGLLGLSYGDANKVEPSQNITPVSRALVNTAQPEALQEEPIKITPLQSEKEDMMRKMEEFTGLKNSAIEYQRNYVPDLKTKQEETRLEYEILDANKETSRQLQNIGNAPQNLSKEILDSFKDSFKTYEQLLQEVSEFKKVFELSLVNTNKNAETERERNKRYEDAQMLGDAIATKLAELLGGQGGLTIPGVDIPDADRKNPPGTPQEKPKPGQPKPGSKIPSPTGIGGSTKALLGGTLLGGAFAAYDVAQLEEQKDLGQITEKEATVKQIGTAGALAGAGTLGAFGAGFGSAFGPVGTAVGGIGGALLGGFLGKEGAEALANSAINFFNTSNEKAVEKQNEKLSELGRLTEEQRMLKEVEANKASTGTGVNLVNNQQLVSNQSTTVGPLVRPHNEQPAWLYHNSRNYNLG